MTELDKFKRRTIRSVARLLRQKKPPDELWSEMKKETGTDCRVLWERMRALCVKKLNRMLAVDDRSDTLPSIARLSLTDWLLVDLVLVHEKIDVIAMDKEDNKAEQKPLVQLFNLVQRFDVEGRAGEPLAEAWAAATVFYNRQGRQCSPMLLQRRWYQLKKLTRCRFYKFWQSYRGNNRLLAEAKGAMPTRLQMAVAKRYPTVITGAFPEWEELVEQKLVILPEEFESKMRITDLPKPSNSTDPDLVVVEPYIETIELGEDSDTEEPKGNETEDTTDLIEDSTDQNEDNADLIEDTEDSGKSNDATAEIDPPFVQRPTQINEMIGVKVKSEPMDEDGLSNVQVVATTHVTELEIPEGTAEINDAVTSQAVNESETLAEENRAEDDLEYNDDDLVCADSLKLYEESSRQSENSKTNVDNAKSDSPGSEDDVIEIPTIVPAIDLESPSEAPTERIMPIISSVSSTAKAQDVVDAVVDNIIKVKAEEYCRKDTVEAPGVNDASNIVDNLIKDKVETFLKTPKEDIMFEEKKVDVSTINLKSETLELTAIDLMADLNFNDDGLEFIDDGVEFIEEMDEPKREPVIEAASPDHESSKGSEDTNKFDLKLLMDPVVYTTKLDHMNIFTKKQLGSVNNKEDIEEIIAESKPVSKKSFDINIKQEDTTSQIDDTNIIDDVGVNDDLFTNQESDDEDEEDITVSPNSYMLKKPRSRTYNPIQLCKNPDFNTKLRRLALGFFSSPRNRQFLNACIPMTIDVSKAFESKLVNGTLYLKSTGANSNVVKESAIDNQSSTSVLPSALPVQSLLDNSKTNILNLIPTPTIDLTPGQRIESIPTPSTDLTSIPTNVIPSPTITTNVNPVVTERQKIINLPDIDKVRKINQQLLTAQVPPIRVYAGDSYRPPTQPIRAVTNQAEQIKPPEALQIAPVETVSAPIPPALSQETCLPTVVKVKSEAAQDNKDLLSAPESIPSEPLPPTKQKLLKIINQAKLSTQEALTKIDGGRKTANDDLKQLTLVKTPKPKANTSTYKKAIYNRVSVPWTPRFAPRPESIDDFLITGDTLNKMLHLMSGNEAEKNCTCCSVKQKKAEWNKNNRAKKKKEANKPAKDSSKQAQEKSSENEGDLDIGDKDSNNPPINTSEKQKVVLAKGRFVRYCCWANQKVCNRKRITKHTCPPDACVCCCREKLAKLLEDKKKSGPIEVSDDEENSLKMACESIENVVQQSRESTENFSQHDQKSSKPKLVIMRTIATSTESNNLETCPADNNVSLHPALVNEPVSPKVTTKIVVQPNELSTFFTKKRPGPKPKLCQTMPNFVPSPKEPLYVPCLSQKPANTTAAQLSIVIDGSRNSDLDPLKKCHLQPPTLTRIAPKENESKVLYLHSKSIAKAPTESPIFLGKNKILLTTVKFPRKDDPPPLPTCEVFQAPKIIPTLPLPNGVQLVLLPSGNVTYTLDEGVELTEEQLATLPTIIAAVKEQLNSSSVQSHAPMGIGNNTNVTSGGQPVMNIPPPELIAHNQTANSSATSTVNLEANETFQDEELPQKIIRTEETDRTDNTAVVISPAPVNTADVDGAKAVNTDHNPLTSEAQNITSPSLNDNVDTHSDSQLVATSDTRTEVGPVAETNSRNESKPVSEPVLTETQSVSESLARADIQNPGTETVVQSDAVDDSNDKDNANNRKTLLSDLMEMSGISAEDATAAEPLTTEQGVQEQVPVFISTEQEQSLPELTPVTSFAELKYACEHNGKFFKLDFETGVIIPINVCIKKNPKPKAPAPVKAVIDLTDDIEESNDSTSTLDAEPLPDDNSFAQKFQQYVFKGKTVTVPSTTIKPIKLFKAVRPPLLNRVIKLDSKLETTTPVIKKVHQKPRKQTFKKVEAVLDLVDSDTPMEEEYLMDSSDTESTKTESESMLVEALEESDYSSDDEPLAKKSKRMKESHEETDKDELVETNIRDAINDAVSENLDPIPNPEGGSEVPKDMDVPMESENTSDGKKEALNINDAQAEIGPENKPVESEVQPDLAPELDPEQDPDVDPELRFMSGPSDNEGEEDCILGV